MQQLLPFLAPNEVFWYTTEELLSITTQYATNKEAAKPLPIPGGREVVPSNIAIQDNVDVSYVAPQVHKIVNVALHREYSPGIEFIFFQGRKDLYHV
jgi:hypothetical protein